MSKFLIASLFTLSIGTPACKDTARDETRPSRTATGTGAKSKSDTSADSKNNITDKTAQGAQGLNLDGTSWTKSCTKNTLSDGRTYYETDQFVFADNTASMIARYYEDATCQTLLKKETGTLIIQTDKPSSEAIGAFESSVQLTGINVIYESIAWANEDQDDYSKSGIVSCQNLNLTRLKQKNDLTECIRTSKPSTFATYYSLMKVNGNQLQTGDCSAQSACTSPATRAKSLSTDIFTKDAVSK